MMLLAVGGHCMHVFNSLKALHVTALWLQFAICHKKGLTRTMAQSR
jgi:hypothetical protein